MEVSTRTTFFPRLLQPFSSFSFIIFFQYINTGILVAIIITKVNNKNIDIFDVKATNILTIIITGKI